MKGNNMAMGVAWWQEQAFLLYSSTEDRMMGAQKSLQSQISTGETGNVKLAWLSLQRKRCTTCFPTRMPEMEVANS